VAGRLANRAARACPIRATVDGWRQRGMAAHRFVANADRAVALMSGRDGLGEIRMGHR